MTLQTTTPSDKGGADVTAAPEPQPPYYAVIFRSRRSATGAPGYDHTADRMDALAMRMPGYLGHHSARGADGVGITVSYWRTKEDIARWRAHPEHAAAIAKVSGWYDWYVSETALVERRVGQEA